MMPLTRHEAEQHAVQKRIAAALERIADALEGGLGTIPGHPDDLQVTINPRDLIPDEGGEWDEHDRAEIRAQQDFIDEEQAAELKTEEQS